MRFLLWLLVVVVVAAGLSLGWMAYDGFTDSAGTATCAVIIGGPLGPDGKPDAAMRASLDRAAQLYQNKTISQMIVTGEAGSGTDGLVAYLTQHGVPVSAIMVDHAATDLDGSARDVADYLKQNNLPNVLIVAPYYEITRSKLALNRAGVSEVLHVHSGAVEEKDLTPAVQAVTDVYQRVYQDKVAPTATSLVNKASAEGQQISQSVKAATLPAATNSAPAPAAPVDSTTDSSAGTTTTPPPATTAASAEVTLTNPQKVTATGIADFQVPGDWTQRIVPPILDPVWASDGTHPKMVAAMKIENAGPISSFSDAVKRRFEDSRFSVTGDFKQEPFTTSYGLQGVRLLGSLSARGKSYELIVYAFPARQGNLAALFSLCPSADAASQIPLTDACAKTMRPW